jgi:hypothetical protein
MYFDMKPVLDDADENDLLLFNYLEGNLSAEEEKALESTLLTDVSLQAELSYWQETYIEPDSYGTNGLEAKLLLPQQTPVQSTGSFQVIIATLLASLLSLVPVPLAFKSQDQLHSYPLSSILPAESKQVAQPDSRKSIDVLRPVKKETIIAEHSKKFEVGKPILIDALPALSLQPLSQNETGDLVLLAEKEIKVYWKKKPATRILSGKERRNIARMKEKALQRRMANEFLKGRVPYVVPLNTNNF